MSLPFQVASFRPDIDNSSLKARYGIFRFDCVACCSVSFRLVVVEFVVCIRTPLLEHNTNAGER